jgi:hypothetical protein
VTTARSHSQLAAENLFLRKQLAFYVERQVKPRRADDATRIMLVALSSLIEWRQILTIREAGHAHWVASKGLSAVLAPEVETSRATSAAKRPAPADQGCCDREPHLG